MGAGPLTRGSRYLEILAARPLVYDGAMGTQLQELELSGVLTAEAFGGKPGCNDYLSVTRPDVVRRVHEAYLEAGADVVETNTFGASRPKLGEFGLADRVREINVAAARIAREAADRFATPDRPRFVAGSIGPSGFLPSSDDPALSAVTFEELAAIYREQAEALIAGGCDVLLIETSQDILEVRAQVAGIQDAFRSTGCRLPLQVQVTLDVSGRMLLGTDVDAVIAILQALPVDVVGLNCSTGPEHMREPVRRFVERCPRPISVIPNAGLPINLGGKAVYPLEPEAFAAQLREFVTDFGVAVVGGCCGTTPAHIRELAAAVRQARVARREPRFEPCVASALRSVALEQQPKPLMVGERLNAQGSRRVKERLLAGDYDGLLAIGREQAEAGAHVLDVCVALTERADEAEQMRRIVKKLSLGLEAPLCIDSTEPSVIRAALETCPGRAIVNSVHLEGGRQRLDAIGPLAVRHGAALVALTIDEGGMARTPERKLAVARRIHDICTGEYGLPPHALIFDALTFTLATGEAEYQESAVATIEGIRAIKRELPGVFTILGVSNVSFGLAPHARGVLNSVFLYHAIQAGLDLAIVNPAHITPYAEIPADQRELAEDLLYFRRPDALARYVAAFENLAPVACRESTEDPLAGLSVAEKIRWQILHRRKDGIEALLDEALREREPAAVLNEILLPAMREVGEKFGSGELILPFVLQSAEVMKRAVAHLEQFFDRQEGLTKGKVVLATVFGDVHDIGKNLVKTILTHNGYTVYDLGKQVPVNTILDKAVEVGADAIGLSALLVSTSKQMPACVQELDRRGLKFPVIVGGAALNPAFGRRIAFLEDGRPYEAGVFYAADAFEGLALVDQLIDAERRQALVARRIAEAREALERERRAPAVSESERSAVRPVSRAPEPPFWGPRVVEGIPLAEVAALIDQKTLFRLQWGAKSTRGEAWEALLKDEFLPRFHRYVRELEGIVVPRAVYGYFRCAAEGQDLVLFGDGQAGKLHAPGQDPTRARDGQEPGTTGGRRELARFRFPRQRGRERLCLADYFGPDDVVALQAVTVGEAVDRRFQELQGADQYSDAYYLHGFAVEAAEATAEWVHRHIRRELGIGDGQGKRYSWGYPAMPDLAHHEIVSRLLPLERIGMALTPAHQLVPEASTVAMVVHHPEARYFAVGEEAVTA